ncbi:hypothetical protein EDC14_100650 [Hydrogenispora ethanolica]|uniref:Uncharacterized protein n=1 Tax=Hydrogenispora ethanolica TaxID=1082276 RepID=A0A4R1S1B7_HYDET|nr:hypothetical protein [Hydrogenispora ethanolica]TCL72340.1 hypothetical protein EDC14_100650 [Hydrogenispora ethanolica]
MENYIALLLLIIPGFIARSVFECLTYEMKKESEQGVLITSLIYNIFILFLNYLLGFIFGLINNDELINISKRFSSISFVMVYIGITLLNSFLVAWLWYRLSPKAVEFINSIRKSERKNKISPTESVLSSLFNNNERQLITIEKNREIIASGIVKKIGISNGEIKELWLVGGKNFDSIRNKQKILFNEIKGTYVNLDNDIIITEYKIDIEKLKANIKNKNTHSSDSSS